MPDLAVFRRLEVRLSLGVLTAGTLGCSVLYAFGDTLTEAHEPPMVLYVHLAVVVLTMVAGAFQFMRALAKRMNPRRPPAALSDLERAMTQLATTVAGNTQDISTLKDRVAGVEGRLNRIPADLVVVIREELAKGEKALALQLGEVKSFVAVATEVLERLEVAKGKGKK